MLWIGTYYFRLVKHQQFIHGMFEYECIIYFVHSFVVGKGFVRDKLSDHDDSNFAYQTILTEIYKQANDSFWLRKLLRFCNVKRLRV